MRKLLIVLFLATLACGGDKTPPATASAVAKATPPPPPTAAAAKDLIANSPDFGEYQFTTAAYTLPMKRAAMNEPARKAAGELRSAGWIGFSGDEVVLPPKSRDDKRFLVRPNGFLDIVPIAKKEFGEVSAVRTNADHTVSADFTWRWIPNEVGQSFKSGLVRERFDQTQHATAKLMWNGSAWTILTIEESKP